jgi:hypothetical protein
MFITIPKGIADSSDMPTKMIILWVILLAAVVNKLSIADYLSLY